MQATQPANTLLPQTPICPTCAKLMRLEKSMPDETYDNLHHIVFVCDCGRTSDQLVTHSD